MPCDVTTSVLRNIDLGGGNFLVEFRSPELSESIRSGQFFMLGIPGGDTLLRRPYSVCGVPGTFADGGDGAMQVLYKVYGSGTRLLSTLAPGATLSVLGPLGQGFEPPSRPDARPLFIAGGIAGAYTVVIRADRLGDQIRTTFLGRQQIPKVAVFDLDIVDVPTQGGRTGPIIRAGLHAEAQQDALSTEFVQLKHMQSHGFFLEDQSRIIGQLGSR